MNFIEGCSYCNDCAACGSSHKSTIQKLNQRIEKLREALEFYGNENNWSNLINVIYQGSYVTCSTINKNDHGEYDKHNVRRAGQKAREALKQDEESAE